MYPSTNTQSSPTAYIEILDIVPPTPPASPYITKSYLHNTVNYINTDIKYDFKATNNNIYAILETLVDTHNKKKSKNRKSQSFHPNYQLMNTT